MADASPDQDVMLCAKCRAAMHTPSKAVLEEDLWRVVEPSPDRASAPNAKDCRAALKIRYGLKRAREIIDTLLTDRVAPATKAYRRHHIMFLDKQPLRLLQQPPEREVTRPTSE